MVAMLMAAAPVAILPKKPRRVVWFFSCDDINDGLNE
jgi:hypothetical protein